MSRQGQAALDEGRLDEAVDLLAQAAESLPSRWDVWFDLGLAHKLRRDWAPSVAANRRATEIDPGRHEAFFNLGVAATAIRDWPSAMYAWRGLGVNVGPGPVPNGDFGPCPVRLNPDTEPEVVWGRRIDPCRIRLESIPMPESGHRWHDVVLHDVVPVGRRTFDGQSLPVFQELARMDPSDAPTFDVVVVAPTVEDRDALGLALADADLGCEDWTESFQMLCAACSEGEVDHDHPVPDADGWRVERHFGVAGDESLIRSSLEAWAGAAPGRAVSHCELAG